MEIKQIYELTNDAVKQVLGQETIVEEDLKNLVSIGDELFNASAYDKYVKSLINHIGRMIFVNRVYEGGAPSVLMDNWEFGSILEKVQMDMPQAQENETWELVDGASYDPNVFYQPKVTVKFFNDLTTFEIPLSFTEKQVKQSFSNLQQYNSFISMLYNGVDKGMTVRTDALIMRTINNFIGETIHADYGNDALSSKSGVKAVNLLYLYNQSHATPETVTTCMQNPEFIRFACYKIKLYASRMRKISKLFNIGAKERFTPTSLLHIVMLSEFKESADIWLQSSTFHNELTKLPNAEDVAYWQGSGTGYDFSDTSKIDIKLASDNTVTVTTSGILATLFDRDALGVSLYERRVTSNYNPKAEFITNWYKQDARYFNDFNENFVVFFVA